MTESNTKLEHQIHLETLHAKNNLIPKVKSLFEEFDEDFEATFQEIDVPIEFGYSLLVQMALHKRADAPTMIGLLNHHYEGDLQATADALTRAIEADLVDYIIDLEVLTTRFEVDAESQAELDRYMYPLPMIVPPEPVNCNTDSGYLTFKKSIILKNNFHTNDVCLDHINRMNQVPLSFDYDTATMVKNSWSNLDHAKEGETEDKYLSRVRAFQKYDATAKDVIDEILIHGNEFYLTHAYDKRGRVYCNGYFATYQGNPWNKSVINFAEKEMVQ